MLMNFKNNLKLKFKNLLFLLLSFVFLFHIFCSIYINRHYNTCTLVNRNKSDFLNVLIHVYGKGEYTCYNEDQKLVYDKIYSNSLNIKDILIVIKTTESHSDRMNYIISTWYQLAGTQV